MGIKVFLLRIFLLFIPLGLCQWSPQVDVSADRSIFQTLSPDESGIRFNNALAVDDQMNFFEYGYFYLGGGVAIGDFNNDGLQDIYFTGNMVPNQLYLNKGGLTFQDVTDGAGVAADDRWITGCAVVDINNDGWDDLYVSVAGMWKSRKNILYVNQGLNPDGVPVFEDLAAAYGLDDGGNSMQAAFLDYDSDGDLDVYVANYPITRFNLATKDYKWLQDNVRLDQSDHLYRNNGDNTFTDVTEAAQLLKYGLTLGVIANDFNQDGLTDLYVSNDFHTPDYFYLNGGNGSFREISQQGLQHTAFYGMGMDAADYNNDGLMDFMQLDMAPADNFRAKSNMASMNPKMFWDMVNGGFHHQYMYNVLQTAMGIREDGIPFYAETAKLSGLDKTDWSWACLFEDYDNDGYRDLFVTNGIRKDINNKDYFKWLSRLEKGDPSLKVNLRDLSLPDLIARMPSKKLDNPIFRNTDGQMFAQANEEWGLNYAGYSNGAAYADLDNDGDVELVINNIDSTAAVFKNLTVEKHINNYLGIQLLGPDKNSKGWGTKISLDYQGRTQFHEHTTVRGFQSSVDQNLHFGLGVSEIVDSITIVWPDRKRQIIRNVKANQKIEVKYIEALWRESSTHAVSSVFTKADDKIVPGFLHRENPYDDFKREVLLPHKMSAFGPALATGDVNGDGFDDLLIGGAKDQAPCLMLSQTDNLGYQDCLALDGAAHEDVDAQFFDADGDLDLDLYVVSGGNEEDVGHAYYQDRLYANEGQGNFTLLKTGLPPMSVSGSIVRAADFDGDGDQDLFVGGRQTPGQYPRPANSVILENVSTPSNIKFSAVADEMVASLSGLGMVTDAVWDDFDGDSDLDLMVVGEWMAITVVENDHNVFKIKEMPDFDTETIGWWNTIRKSDFDKDGDNDYVLGNLGLNYKYKASKEESFDIYAGDFDVNGKPDIVLGYYEKGTQFPVRGKQCSSEQIPSIGEKYSTYDDFASAELSQIYSPMFLDSSLHYRATEFSHVYIENLGGGSLAMKALPMSTQISTINAIEILDFNHDGHLDLVMGGNLMNAEVETPRSDACFGWLLLGDGMGGFMPQDYISSGLYVPYETRKIGVMHTRSGSKLVFANNNGPLSVYQF